MHWAYISFASSHWHDHGISDSVSIRLPDQLTSWIYAILNIKYYPKCSRIFNNFCQIKQIQFLHELQSHLTISKFYMNFSSFLFSWEQILMFHGQHYKTVYVLTIKFDQPISSYANRPVSQIRVPPGGLSWTSGKLWQDYSNCYMFWT